MAGKLQSQKRKKLTKSLVFVPELVGMEFGKSSYLVQIDLSIRVTHCPPIHDCTPYQMQAIAARLKTGHSEPQMPKEALLTTGKLMWYVAPIRPVKQMKQAAIA